jgi:charged multivesicular body protein 6
MGGSFSSSNNKPIPSKKKHTPPPISDIDRAVLDLKVSRDKLTKYKKQLEQDDAKLLAKAKQAKDAGQTTTALNLLKLRKHKQTAVASVEQQLLTVLQMVDTISSKENEKEVLQSMKVGKQALQKLHEETTLEDVMELMDTIEEQAELEHEISAAMGGVPALSLEDEELVEAELEELEQAMAGSEKTSIHLPQVPSGKPLPETPTTVPVPTTPATAETSSKPARVAVAS